MRKQRDFLVSYELDALLQHIANDTGIEEEQLKVLHKAIEQLNQVEKAIVMLYMEDKAYEEMEDILGISHENLRVKMTRIKEKLRAITKND